MDLYLVRHGEAGEPDFGTWPDDSLRPLTAQGEKRFRRAARALRELGASVDILLSSPWVRAWRTAELLEKEARWPKPLACQALESGRAPAEVLQAMQPFVGVNAVAVVGHEPSLHELASYLLTAETGHVQIELSKGGVARLELGEAMRPGAARLRWLLSQKILRAL